ncbi:TerB N-terminal domain-containing protein [Paenibacillus sp. FSL R5-0407]|uniref:TerB N-terminal domain-containing protein n=1 Tax=Paenibacillus sp. FSL R5-0407 TaxID=2975320 RepID=UPI0030F82D3F
MNDKTDKHDIHIEQSGQQNRREQQLRFAELELGAPEPQERETVSRVVTPDGWERSLDWQQDFRYVSREGQFVQKARELESQTEDHAEFVPFQTYWPTYDQMQPGQLKWYLYWRGEVRSERYHDTDLSYLFVYLYELIHGIGWSEPVQGVQLMDRVWHAYRKRYPKLDQYVREWKYDFALVFGLDLPPFEPLAKLPRSLSPELRELEWKRRFSAEPVELTWDLVLHLCDYDIEKSRYYNEQGRKDLREYIPKVIVLVDGYLAKTTGNKLINHFMPREKKVTRYLFRSAVYDYEQYGRTATVSILAISEHLPLRAYLTQLVRFTENKLRELSGFKGKLRGITLEAEVEELVSRFLHKEFELRKAEEAKARAPKVKINTAKLRKLQHESDEVRDMLLTEQFPVIPENQGSLVEHPVSSGLPAMEISLGHLVSQAKQELGSLRSRNRNRKDTDGPQQAEMDFERGWQIFEEESPANVALETMKSEAPKGDQRPELSDEDNCAEGMELPEEWRELWGRLSESHKKMLSALLNGDGDAVRYDIAEQAGSMPELLLDEINGLAMEWIGDLLIDGDEITEEYRQELSDMLGSRC